ncbi:unnamed protein product [Camellia sinensis]
MCSSCHPFLFRALGEKMDTLAEKDQHTLLGLVDNLANRILEDHVVEGAKDNFVEVGKDNFDYHCYMMGKGDMDNYDYYQMNQTVVLYFLFFFHPYVYHYHETS